MVSSKVLAAAFATGAVAGPAWYGNSTTSAVQSFPCNPAHAYPTGQVCTTVSGSLTLVTLTGSATPSASYACNPAHQYPEGQVCTEVSGSLTLVTKTGSATASATPSTTGYPCNPAHEYPEGRVCTSVSGSLTLLPPTTSAAVTASATPSGNSSVNACYDAYNKCRQPTNGVSANQAYCASQYAACLGYNPFSNGTNTVTPVLSQPDVYVTQVVTAFTTYCPSATTLTYNSKTYTVTSATTLTITDCPCKVTTPVKSLPPATTVTAVVPHYTTECPAPSGNKTTTLTIESKTYTVSKSTVITVSCAGGCTVTTPVSKIPATSAPGTTKSVVVETPGSTPATTSPTTAAVTKQSTVPAESATTKSTESTTKSTVTAASATTSTPARYTGAADKLAGSGALLLGALGLFAL